MRHIFFSHQDSIFLVQSKDPVSTEDRKKISWMFKADYSEKLSFEGLFLGPRREMITPWSTNAVEIASNIGVLGLTRIEKFQIITGLEDTQLVYDPMTESLYQGLDQASLEVSANPEPLRLIEDIPSYNQQEGLALSGPEISFLQKFVDETGRLLTDAELFGFAQINSEHCRHKIFNGTFIIDGEQQKLTLFELIKSTAKGQTAKNIVSAYKDNVAFIEGLPIHQFSAALTSSQALVQGKDRIFSLKEVLTVISLKAETHNFPTTVEPFSGASTGSGGEIRDRMAGGQGSLPLAGSAVYMTSYPRLAGSISELWEQNFEVRNWKYQSPQEILTKASNGASDFGNKFGQPLITGSLLTFEGESSRASYAFDRTLMLAGGIGYTSKEYALKSDPEEGELIVVLGGDNYRIGMAGSSVSSVDSGVASKELELSAVQRANPEMQKRVYNVIRELVESGDNPVTLIHDHGAGGHLNCLAELVENSGGVISIDALPIGDKTLSLREILSNESQERMGLVIPVSAQARLEQICQRERAPVFVVGKITSDKQLIFTTEQESIAPPVDIPLDILLGSSPETVLTGESIKHDPQVIPCSFESVSELTLAIKRVLSIEAVACKDWLTNKVDRSVTGLVACQQCTGPLQLPLNNLGVMALDYLGGVGVATSIGHAPVPALIDEAAGSRLAIAESLTNILWAELDQGLSSVALSANWMWPAKKSGENKRLYRAVEAASKFAIDLGVAIPTGKDSLSMTMNYDDGQEVRAPGTVVISASAPCLDIQKTVSVDLKQRDNTSLLYVNLSGQIENHLGGSSFAQTCSIVGDKVPDVIDPGKFISGFSLIQKLVSEEKILAGHDISSGGFITAALEMAFAGNIGFDISVPAGPDFLFCEKPGVLLQLASEDLNRISQCFNDLHIETISLGEVRGNAVRVSLEGFLIDEFVAGLREIWFKPSALLDGFQTNGNKALERRSSFSSNQLSYNFPKDFVGKLKEARVDPLRGELSNLKAAVLRDKGTNGDREMAFALFASGFDVKDITMHELINGQETLADINFLVFPGGFTNSDVLGAARGWAGSFLYNKSAMQALNNFLTRDNTLSLGVCNGCQLMSLLGIVSGQTENSFQLDSNDSGKFESGFVNLEIPETNSIMLSPLIGSRLAAWVAHGEGKFVFEGEKENYQIAMQYSYSDYPANPNGSAFNTAGLVSANGRHLAMMPHIERSIRSWHWPYHGSSFEKASFSPWMLAFTAARDWILERA